MRSLKTYQKSNCKVTKSTMSWVSKIKIRFTISCQRGMILENQYRHKATVGKMSSISRKEINLHD